MSDEKSIKEEIKFITDELAKEIQAVQMYLLISDYDNAAMHAARLHSNVMAIAVMNAIVNKDI